MMRDLESRLIDTNIVSMSFRRDTRYLQYRPHLVGRDLAVSFMTVAEMYEGAALAGWGSRKWARLALHLQSFFVISSDDDVCRWYATARASRRTQPISVNDALIAATALAHRLELVT